MAARQLRPYQIGMKDESYTAWNAGFKNVLLVLPTGGGKTVTFCSVARDLVSWGMPTVIMVHRKELVEQICMTLADEGLEHNIISPRTNIRRISGAQVQVHKRSFYNHRALITVISLATMKARAHKHQEWAKTIKAWIVDEAAHVTKVNTWGKVIDYFPNAIGLGVTATPERLDKRGLGRHADGVFDVMVQGPSTAWMIQNSFLSKYKIVVPPSDYRNHLGTVAEGHDYTIKQMATASLKSHIVGDVIDNYLKFAPGKQAIVFNSDIKSAEIMEAAFLERGITAKLLTGETDAKVRFDSLIAFREKKIQVLLNVDLFDEGLDVPGIEVVILARPTKSKGKFLQMCGRVLRYLPGKVALIIDHVGNIAEHGLPDDKRTWTLDRISKRRDKINLHRICKNHVCAAPYDRTLSECPYCGVKDEPLSRRDSGGGRAALEMVDGDLVLLDPDTIRELQEEAILEDPVSVANRVTAAAGPAAGRNAMKNQRERIEMQEQLGQTIALWAGIQRNNGMSDRQINKHFYIHYGMTITEALGEPKAAMIETKRSLENEFTWN